jgi:hypothetical protein
MRGRASGGDEETAGGGSGAPLGVGGGLDGGVVVGFEAVDGGVELGLLGVEVEVAVGVEGEHGVVLEDDVRWGGEALDVQEGEANAAAGELGHGGGGVASPETIEVVGAEGVEVAFVVEVEGVAAVEFDLHDGVFLFDRQDSRDIECVKFELRIYRHAMKMRVRPTEWDSRECHYHTV